MRLHVGARVFPCRQSGLDGEIGVARGVDEKLGGDGAPAVLVLYYRVGHAAVGAFAGRDHPGMQERADERIGRYETVEREREGLHVENGSGRRRRRIFHYGFASLYEFAFYAVRQAGNDLSLACSVVERVPDGDVSSHGRSSEKSFVLDDRHPHAFFRGAHGGEHARRASAENAHVG